MYTCRCMCGRRVGLSKHRQYLRCACVNVSMCTCVYHKLLQLRGSSLNKLHVAAHGCGMVIVVVVVVVAVGVVVVVAVAVVVVVVVVVAVPNTSKVNNMALSLGP